MTASYRSHPLASGCPPEWAASWGHDRCGVFAGFVINEIEYRMRWIAPGAFLMGSPFDEVGRCSDEGPQHHVTITRGFWLGEVPVTQSLWAAVMEGNPSRFKGPQRPVESVSWEDCRRLCAHLERLIPELGIRLPTEAEWEYACRAGTTGATYGGEGRTALDAIAWWSGNSKQRTHPVRQKQANPWGLHDMLGNVWEWCSDGMREYSNSSAVDPVDSGSSGMRVYRGAGWYGDTKSVRAAYRVAREPGLGYDAVGFRLARGQD